MTRRRKRGSRRVFRFQRRNTVSGCVGHQPLPCHGATAFWVDSAPVGNVRSDDELTSDEITSFQSDDAVSKSRFRRDQVMIDPFPIEHISQCQTTGEQGVTSTYELGGREQGVSG